MDGDRFDALTRALGAGRSRRGILRGLGATALGAGATAVGLDRAGAAARCRPQAVVCSKNTDCCSSNCLPKDRTGRRYCAECGSPAQCPAPVNASAICTGGTCSFTCNAGFQSDGAGGCVAASTCPPCGPVGQSACFWLDCSDFSGACCWVEQPGDDQSACQELDSCSPGGGGGSGGGCYKWDTTSC
jgi:hypothetical protein